MNWLQISMSFKVIVNNSVSQESISKKMLSDIFLKKKIEWNDNTKIKPVDLNVNSGTRAAFSNEVHNKSVNAIKAYWQKQIFSGRNVPPVEKNNDQAVIDYVKSNPGAIGYISAGTSAQGVKTLKINN